MFHGEEGASTNKTYMTYTTHRTNSMDEKEPMKPVAPHGGYRKLKSFQMAEIVYDGTAAFCKRFVPPRFRTNDQMVHAAQSGKHNIAEASSCSGTSRKSELKLVGVARASLEELLLDYEDFLRQRGLSLWAKEHEQAKAIRKLAYLPDRTYKIYSSYIERGSPEVVANTMICIIHQTNYLLDRQLRQLEKQFLAEGGFTERLYHARKAAQQKPPQTQ